MERQRPSRLLQVLASSIGTVLLMAGCSDDENGGERAMSEVEARTAAVAEAQEAYDRARAGFCDDATAYVASLDRYGSIFSDQAATVGDVKTLGADLARPGDEVASSAQAAVDAHADLAEAQAKLAEAQAEEAAEASGSQPQQTASTTSTTSTLLPAATVDRVQTEQQDLDAALEGISDSTPLMQAGVQVNSAAFALEAAWLRVLADAGCLSEDQMNQANVAVVGYTAAVQSALATLDFYSGEVDGIYGPETVDAVMAFQTAHSLPPTGYIDAATALALESALVAEGGQAAVQAVASTAAVQSMLKLAGYWAGEIDGQWTSELTAALSSFQTSLGIPATGVMDTATMDAVLRALSEDRAPSTTVPSIPSMSTSEPSAPTSESPTTSGR